MSSELEPIQAHKPGRLPTAVSRIAAIPHTVRHPAESVKHFWSSASDEPDVFEEMTLGEHLMDLRGRIMKMAMAVGAAFVIGLFLSKPFLHLIQKQANIKDGFQILSPTEPFTDYLKIAMYIAVVIASPVLLYQFLAFVAPGMTRKEKRYVFMAIPFVILLFIVGAGFAFFVAAPAAFEFLSGFGGDLFIWHPQGEEVIQFYQTMMIGLGLAFRTSRLHADPGEASYFELAAAGERLALRDRADHGRFGDHHADAGPVQHDAGRHPLDPALLLRSRPRQVPRKPPTASTGRAAAISPRPMSCLSSLRRGLVIDGAFA